MISRAPFRFLYDVRLAAAAVALMSLAAAGCDKAALLAPTRSVITLTAGQTVLSPGASTPLTVTLLENSGQPVPNGTLVRFTTNLGRVEPSEVQTRNGVATSTFIAGTESGTAEIRATSGLASGTTTTTGSNGAATSSSTTGAVIQIRIGAAAAETITIAATPSAVPASGGTVTIIASVLDPSGNRLTGIPISFSTTTGSLSATSAMTDSAGEARVQLTTTRQAEVTAQAGTKNAKLTVGVNPALSFTLATSPANPAAGQPVTLTITPAANTAPRVTVNWGDGNEQDIGAVVAVRSVTHTYSAPGFFTITATGTQEGDTFSNSIAVTVAQRPPVQLTVNPQSGTTATLFSFTITPTTGALISNVSISYGDGQTDDLGAISTQTTRQHKYNAANTYTAVVTQTETNGTVTQASVTVTVSP